MELLLLERQHVQTLEYLDNLILKGPPPEGTPPFADICRHLPTFADEADKADIFLRRRP